jgi:hypothetical protein
LLLILMVSWRNIMGIPKKNAFCSLNKEHYKPYYFKEPQIEPFNNESEDSGWESARQTGVIEHNDKWVPGSVLEYYFFDDENEGAYLKGVGWKTWKGSEREKNLVRQAFDEWKNTGINLSFVETEDRENAKIRIGFMKGDGSWSYVGTASKGIGLTENDRTMNFGWDISNDYDTALHEIGHAIALSHEHQNANSRIVWNTEEVYKYFKEEYGWSDEKIKVNVIDNISKKDANHSGWDKDSIMHYAFKANLIEKPDEYKDIGITPAGGLSDLDVSWMRTQYPQTLKENNNIALHVNMIVDVNIPNGGHVNYHLIFDDSRKYSLQLLGESDAVIVLFENTDNGWRQVAASNDTGTSANARVTHFLDVNKEYSLRVKLNWQGELGRVKVGFW